MDIEGAELAALNGAVNTIKTYRPKMALSAYHKFEDVYALPNFIHSIDQGYQFYLRHFSDNLWETVLFCVPCSSTNTMNKVYECEDYSKMLHVINMIRIIIKGNKTIMAIPENRISKNLVIYFPCALSALISASQTKSTCSFVIVGYNGKVNSCSLAY